MLNKTIEKDMTPILKEDLGKLYATENSKYKQHYGIFECQYCGEYFKSLIHHVKSGGTKSCGCYNKQSAKERHTTHGLTKHPLYNTWNDMKKRCYNPKYKNYIHYGGRGIKVYEEWKIDFLTFYNWAIQNGWVKGLSIDRIDVNGNYEPDNCRWVTQEIQCRNTRDISPSNKSGYRGVYYHKGIKKWQTGISVCNKIIYLGVYQTALEAAKAYETYVRVNNLEHNFTPALTEEEIENLTIKDNK